MTWDREEKTLFSLRDAARYTNTPEGTFRHHVYVQKRIQGIVVGHTLVFTKEQLDDYVANDRHTDIVPDKSQFYSIAEAAEAAGITTNAMKQQVYGYEALPTELVGADRIIHKEDLDEYIRIRSSSRPPSLAGAPVDRLEKKTSDMTLDEVANFADVSMRTVYRWVHERGLPAYKKGNRYYVTADDLRAFAEGELGIGSGNGNGEG